ncbi:MAG TPA: hypothetical protein VG651_08660 [Stellaceae bacterium]|nr:hypothetical protein [Stellaceae bacterium]
MVIITALYASPVASEQAVDAPRLGAAVASVNAAPMAAARDGERFGEIG